MGLGIGNWALLQKAGGREALGTGLAGGSLSGGALGVVRGALFGGFHTGCMCESL